MKTRRVWFWLIPLALLWSAIHLSVYLIRFGRLPSDGIFPSLVYFPMGLISGTIFLLLWTCATKKPEKVGLILGYFVSCPIAFIGSLLSGLVYQPLVGTLLWGAGPLVFGTSIGALIGRILAKLVPEKA